MSALLLSILRIAAQVLAGVGVGELLDKFVKPKVPSNYYPEPLGIGFRVPKILWLIIAFVAGGIAIKYIGKKLKLKILK